MADSKITALTAISTVDPTADPLVIVDVSDTSMAASGTTKKSTINQLLGAGGTATLASATITGDLTVDTNTLKVVSASDVVGINTTSPLTGNDAGLTIGAIGTVKALNIGLQNTFARLREKDAIDAFAITTNITASNTQDDATKSSWKARMGFGNGNDNFIISRSGVGSTTFYDLLSVSTGSCVWYDGAGGTRMTLNATGLGVGTSPSALLHVQKSQNSETTAVINNTNTGTSAGVRLDLQSNSLNYLTLQSFGQNYSGNAFGIAAAKLNIISENSLTAFSSGLAIGTSSSNPLYFATSNAVRATIDSSGNVVVNTAAVATTATDGFLYITGCAGTPTGTPTAKTGRVPLVVDTTNNKLYFYSGGAWVAAN